MTSDDVVVGEQKADFSGLYEQPDPRAYLDTMSALGYHIPERAVPIFEAVLAHTGARTVLDVCCSYGINAGQLRYAADIDTLADRYRRPELAELPDSELVDADRAFFAGRPRHTELRVLGLDVSVPAISYAVRAGLLTDGWAENLEVEDPSGALALGVQGVQLIISTGGVGYVGHRTFDRLLASIAEPHRLWAVVFVLRMFDYSPIAESFARYGLVTEQLPAQRLPQRRFVDHAERTAALHDVRRRGLDPEGVESTGWYYADCYLTRPAGSPPTPLPRARTS